MESVLNTEDILFLKSLAKELKTQDRLYTGKPVIYQIREEDYITGIDPQWTDDICLIDTYGDTRIFKSTDEIKEYFNDHYSDEKYEELLKDINESGDLEVVYEMLEAHDKAEGWVLTGYQKQHKYKNFFLTKKALDNHVKQNHYHYEEPDYFINHAWRNPELQRLLEIVEKFEKVE
jgi:hypothetical protein